MKKNKNRKNKEVQTKTATHSLAVIYTFAPYVDTSGNVFAKRMQSEIKEKLTVITNKCISNPPVDKSLEKVVSPYLHKRLEMQATFTYRDWKHFDDFITQAYDAYLNEIKQGAIFKNLYSRSMSVISHLVAYKIKCHNPKIKWIAEFSDPIIKEVDGNERNVEIPLDWLTKNDLVNKLRAFDNNQNLFFISELLVYLYADEIVFTNRLQEKYMLSYLKEKVFDANQLYLLLKNIQHKSVVKPHPILEQSFYTKGKKILDLDKNYINIGYFGNFNINRGLDEFILSWQSLTEKRKKSIRLFVFTNMNAEKIYTSIPKELAPFVKIDKALCYLDFLGILNSFDFVLSLDTQVTEILGINPFLPSKVSDYLGSNVKVLALLEKNSPTDFLDNPRILKQYFGKIDLNTLFK